MAIEKEKQLFRTPFAYCIRKKTDINVPKIETQDLFKDILNRLDANRSMNINTFVDLVEAQFNLFSGKMTKLQKTVLDASLSAACLRRDCPDPTSDKGKTWWRTGCGAGESESGGLFIENGFAVFEPKEPTGDKCPVDEGDECNAPYFQDLKICLNIFLIHKYYQILSDHSEHDVRSFKEIEGLHQAMLDLSSSGRQSLVQRIAGSSIEKHIEQARLEGVDERDVAAAISEELIDKDIEEIRAKGEINQVLKARGIKTRKFQKEKTKINLLKENMKEERMMDFVLREVERSASHPLPILDNEIIPKIEGTKFTLLMVTGELEKGGGLSPEMESAKKNSREILVKNLKRFLDLRDLGFPRLTDPADESDTMRENLMEDIDALRDDDNPSGGGRGLKRKRRKGGGNRKKKKRTKKLSKKRKYSKKKRKYSKKKTLKL